MDRIGSVCVAELYHDEHSKSRKYDKSKEINKENLRPNDRDRL